MTKRSPFTHVTYHFVPILCVRLRFYLISHHLFTSRPNNRLLLLFPYADEETRAQVSLLALAPIANKWQNQGLYPSLTDSKMHALYSAWIVSLTTLCYHGDLIGSWEQSLGERLYSLKSPGFFLGAKLPLGLYFAFHLTCLPAYLSVFLMTVLLPCSPAFPAFSLLGEADSVLPAFPHLCRRKQSHRPSSISVKPWMCRAREQGTSGRHKQ